MTLGVQYRAGMSRAFLDAASGQPLHPAAIEAENTLRDRTWADPNARHHEGVAARVVLDAARATVASILQTPAQTITFSPSSPAALRTILDGLGHLDRPRWLCSTIERVVVRETLQCWAPHLHPMDPDVDPTDIPVISTDRTGRIDPNSLRDQLAALGASEHPVVVVLQAANAEIGTVQDLAALISVCRGYDCFVIVDASNALGYVELPAGWDALFADAGTWAGPPAAAVVAVAESSGWRGSGASRAPADSIDVNVAVQAAAALDAVHRNENERNRIGELTQRLRDELPSLIEDLEIFGDEHNRLPQVLSFSLLYVDAERLATELDRMGIAVGSGSACAAAAGLPSHVLSAIGALTHGNVRVSVPWNCPTESIDALLEQLPSAVESIRRDAGV